ncbi:MAG: PhoPQ-activated protein PqaA family protein, partial [Ferruginibacter sp.]
MKNIVVKLLFACITIQLLPGSSIAQTAITPANALQSYLHNGDKTYQWEIKETFKIKTATVYALLLTSQKWREYTWTHELSIIVPQKINHTGALLFITGGSINDKGLPNW